MNTPSQREPIRQRLLMEALRSGRPDALQGWVWQPTAARHGLARGLAAYVANAGASAERALAARYSTVQALLGEESFGQLARALWHQRPPGRGDLGQWGDDLPAWIEGDPQLAGEPYLADAARLDDAVFQAAQALDAEPDLSTLHRLGDQEPERLRLRAPPGAALVRSSHPIATLWRAHHDPVQRTRPDPFAEARQALAEQRAETAWVWRQGWAVHVTAVDPINARFMQDALLEHQPLSFALDLPDFDFTPWLQQAVVQGWLLGVDEIPA